jgi:competence protein ComEA
MPARPEIVTTRGPPSEDCDYTPLSGTKWLYSGAKLCGIVAKSGLNVRMWEAIRGWSMSPRRKQFLGLGIIVAVVAGLVIVVLRSERPRDLVLQIEPVSGTTDITVYVSGAVEEPGLYTLPRGSRVADALDLAGALPDADLSSVDMARELRNEQSIAVPFEAPTNPPAAAAIPSPIAAAPATNPPESIDVNVASAPELERLPGIGPVLAERIVQYREEHGPFSSLNELSAVQGISDRMVEDLRARATVGP